MEPNFNPVTHSTLFKVVQANIRLSPPNFTLPWSAGLESRARDTGRLSSVSALHACRSAGSLQLTDAATATACADRCSRPKVTRVPPRHVDIMAALRSEVSQGFTAMKVRRNVSSLETFKTLQSHFRLRDEPATRVNALSGSLGPQASVGLTIDVFCFFWKTF